MYKMYKKIGIFILGIVLVFSMIACNNTADKVMSKKEYYDYMSKEYNRELFYHNDLDTKAADPSVIYIDSGEDKGWFYMYATSDDIGATGYLAWKSKDLSKWTKVGVAFNPSDNAWARQDYWAPEVIAHNGKYYMYYSASNINKNDRKTIGVAISDSPKGPFLAYSGTNSNGDILSARTPLIDQDRFDSNLEIHGQALIDASPFIDYDDNGSFKKAYLTFTLDIQLSPNTLKSSIWGCELGDDMVSPKYDTIKQLTRFNYATVEPQEGEQPMETTLDRSNVTNEGSFLYKHNGKYYLTFSTAQYYNKTYSIAQAVGDSPLGPFTKVAHDKGGLIMSALDLRDENLDYDHMQGTGHHSLVKVGDELFMAYHAFIDNYDGSISKGRAVAIDRVNFVSGDNGEEIMYVSGPTYSVQPLAEKISGYKNVAKLATVEASNIASDSLKNLNSGMHKNHSYAPIEDAVFNANNTTINLKWEKGVDIRAIMVYNAFDYEHSFEKIEEIAIKTKVEKDGKVSFDGNLIIKNLDFDMKKHVWVSQWNLNGWDTINDKNYKYEKYDLVMRPGGAAIAEFDTINTTSITIKINSARKGGNASTLNIGDIVVLGK